MDTSNFNINDDDLPCYEYFLQINTSRPPKVLKTIFRIQKMNPKSFSASMLLLTQDKDNSQPVQR